jgi:UrcA family protein
LKHNWETIMNTSTSSTGLRGLIATAIFGALALSLSAVAAADPPSSAGITVKYADLNIATPSGALKLYARIEAAAQKACGYFWFKTDEDEARCVHNTIAKAVNKVNQPALSAVFVEKYKTSAPSALVSQSR